MSHTPDRVSASRTTAPHPQAAVPVQHKRAERHALVVGIIVNTLCAAAGLAVFFMTGLKAMFLDSAFTWISVVSGIVAAFLSTHSMRTSERFPNGKFALEPMYAIMKALLTLSLLLFSVMDVTQEAVEYLRFGEGEPVRAAPVVVYEAIVVFACFALYGYYRRCNRRLGSTSTMLAAETNSTMIDGLMSFGIGVMALVLLLLPHGTVLEPLRYTGDFFITVILAIATIREPFLVLKQALIELIGGVHDDETIGDFVTTQALSGLPSGLDLTRCDVFKTGMSFTVNVLLTAAEPHGGSQTSVADLIAYKHRLERSLVSRLHIVDVNIVFD